MIYALITAALYAPLVWWVYDLHRDETAELAALGWNRRLSFAYAVALAWLYALGLAWLYWSSWLSRRRAGRRTVE